MNRLIRREQLLQLIAAHFRELIREPEVIFWGMIFPILMSLGLGIAFTKKVDIVRTVDLIKQAPAGISDLRPASAVERFLAEKAERLNFGPGEPARYKITVQDHQLGNTTFFFQTTSWKTALTLIKRGNLSVAITEGPEGIRYHFDPANTDAQLTYLKLSKLLGGAASFSGKATDTIQPLTVRGTRYIDFLVPGLIALGIMMSCMWGLSYGMIEKRSQKLLRRMVATPMRKSHLLMAMMIVRTAMNLIESLLLFVFAFLVFDISIQGNLGALFAIFLAGNIAFAGIAVFVCSRTERTETGNGLINAVVMPMMVLSGIFFSYHNFPEWSHPFIRKLPLTLLADGLRSIFIEGAGFEQIVMPLAILTTVGISFFGLGLKVFKWH